MLVHTIFAIGRNYAAHAKEMKSEVPTSPMVFSKPASSLTAQGPILIPPGIGRVDHEVELVVALGSGGKNISREEAGKCIAGFAVGIDLTARDLQAEAKKNGSPWLLSKGLDTFACIGSWIGPARADATFGLELRVNGEVRQSGSTANMIFSTLDIIAYLSTRFTLSAGTLIYTGTPEGVSPLQIDDRVDAILVGTESRFSAVVKSA